MNDPFFAPPNSGGSRFTTKEGGRLFAKTRMIADRFASDISVADAVFCNDSRGVFRYDEDLILRLVESVRGELDAVRTRVIVRADH